MNRASVELDSDAADIEDDEEEPEVSDKQVKQGVPRGWCGRW